MKTSLLDRYTIRSDVKNREVLRDMGIGVGAIMAIVALSSLASDDQDILPVDYETPVTYLDMFSD